MTKTKWSLILLGGFDLILIVMHYTDYFFLFLKPTGYNIPLLVNIIVLAIISIRSRFPKRLTIPMLVICIPILFAHSFMAWFLDHQYTTIHSPISQQSLVIEYRHATLGETTYFYNFHKTKFGFVGKRLDDQAISMMVLRTDHPTSIDAEGALGLGNEEWLTKNTVRLYTWQGMKDVDVSRSQSSFEEKKSEVTIDKFIDQAKNKENGQTITINGNLLTIRYNEASDQEWIEITNERDQGAIPTQQCSHIVPNKEHGYYMLEECTHQWEYPLYPMTGRQ